MWRVVFGIALMALASDANAAAWVLPEGEAKAIVKHNRFDYEVNIAGEQIKLDAYDAELFLEYGVTKNITTSFKYTYNYGEVRNVELYNYGLTEAQIRYPIKFKFKVGLLPPFTQTIIEQILKLVKLDIKVERERPLSVAAHALFNEFNDELGWGVSIAQGDKLTLGKIFLLQEAEYQEIFFPHEHWRRALHKAELGYRAFAIGHEVDYFQERKRNFRTISRFYYVSYGLPKVPVSLRFGRGYQHRPIANLFAVRIDMMRFELHYRF